MNKDTKETKYCAFCTYHKQHMTVKQMKLKECMFKKNISDTCPYLQKNLEHSYWIIKNQKKVNRKLKSTEY